MVDIHLVISLFLFFLQIYGASTSEDIGSWSFLSTQSASWQIHATENNVYHRTESCKKL